MTRCWLNIALETLFREVFVVHDHIYIPALSLSSNIMSFIWLLTSTETAVHSIFLNFIFSYMLCVYRGTGRDAPEWRCSWRPEEGVRSPGLELQAVTSHPMEVLWPNLGSLQEPYTLWPPFNFRIKSTSRTKLLVYVCRTELTRQIRNSVIL